MERQFDDFAAAATLIGKEVCFKRTQRCKRLHEQGISRGTIVNIQLSPKFKGKTAGPKIIFVIEFGPSYRRTRSYFLREDITWCNGRPPAP